MNLSLLERRIRDGDLSREAARFLLDCRGECEWLDYKEVLKLETDEQVCSFGKDVLAMKNVGGGYIVVGVRDKTWAPVGIASPLPYDGKLLRDQVRKATGLDLDVDIVHHEVSIAEGQRLVALILVRSSKKRSRRRIPTLTIRDFCAGKPFGIRRGEIYVRNGSSTEKVGSTSDLEDLLDALEDQAQSDALE